MHYFMHRGHGSHGPDDKGHGGPTDGEGDKS
jgi:hypothetical protein